ncbi:MAG: hypothetical protein WC719_00025 [Patescibacteria group bacterium]|jgi:hypothetical protein
MGILFTILGVISIFRLWENHIGFAIFMILVTLYQASSLNEIKKEMRGQTNKDRWQGGINLASSIIILGFLIYSFF